MLTTLAVWAGVTGTAGLVMALARTPPNEAASNLSKWLEWIGFHHIPRWLRDRAADRWVLRYGLVMMAILFFVGGIGFDNWVRPPIVPTSLSSSPPSPTFVSSPPIVNPIHDEGAKWRLTKNLRYLAPNINGICEIMIVRYPSPYSEVYADDLKEILTAVGWPFKEKFAQESLPRGLSLVSTESPLAKDCNKALTQRFSNDVHLPGGIDMHWLLPQEITPYMKNCSNPMDCIQIGIGLERQP
jgi:hypothetical protein